uniref:Pdz domain containing protein n=2 Tax=Echinococcus granulosus TaxID=6210 RepID=A0A068WCE0_ECHGR|nr:pdz domain containing protein [Echinococcus granulosus]
MSSLASSSSAISSSEEDVRERPQDDSKDKNDHQEAVESSDGADEKADTAGSDVEEENVDEKEDENDDKELVIEYTVELDQVEEKPNEKTDGSISSELKASENREATPTPESVKMEDHPSESKESPIEAPKTPVLIAIKAPPSPQVPSNSEVVEEVPRSVKEQIAIFSNLNLQKAHDTPKLGASSAFAIDHSNQNNVLSKSTLPASFTQAPRVATAYKNVSPQPFGTAETDLIKQADRQPTEHPPNQPDSTKFDRPQPLDRPSEPPPQPKKFVVKATTSTPPMTFCVPFGNGSQSVKSTESPVKEVSPSQYLGPGVIAQTSRPPMMIRLRRPGPEAPWGFAVFGGADYGCPPFISRVTLHSIAARAGLEVGDIVVSVCDSPVQEKEHSRIKAEILRAGNELDFTVIKQGIDKEILAQRAPHLLRTPAPPPAPGAAHTRQSIWATGTWTSPTSPNYADKATRTRSFRLLDEHLNAMSAQPPSPLKVTTSQPARVFSPTQSYHFESASRSSYAMGQNHHTTGMSNYGRTNRTIYPSTHSPNTSHGFYAQSQPVSTSRTAFTAPTGFSQGSGAWRNTSPTRVGYDSFASPSRPGTWSSSTNQQMDYYESRNTVERSSTDDPGLMTQYYGTQQTCYAKYHPQSQQHQQRMLHQGSSYQSSSEWSRVSPQQSLPTSRLVYRPQGTNFTTAQGAKEQFRHHQFQQQQQNFVSGYIELPGSGEMDNSRMDVKQNCALLQHFRPYELNFICADTFPLVHHYSKSLS